jgi:WD40 repeat protein
MTWRLHLSNQAIQYINILPGKPSLLAVWTQRTRVFYFDLESGAPMGERAFKDGKFENRQDEKWREFVASLTAPNKAYLPVIRTPQAEIFTSEDGRTRLYDTGKSGLYLEANDKESKLETKNEAPLVAVGMDRFLGLIAALDEKASIHIFQQQVPVGIFETGLYLDDDVRPQIAISHGGGSIFVTDGQQVALIDPNGQARKRIESHYRIGKLDCSPNGQHLITADTETNVIRVYNGTELTATHQRHAVDLMAEADQLQLIADFPPATVALNGLTINNKGVLAFALAGVVCASDITCMDALPHKTL